MYIYNNEQYETLPERIRLEDGTTRTSLHELSTEQQETLGLVYYTVITPEFDSLLQQWDGSYTFDHDLRTATKNIVDRDANSIKNDKLNALLQEQSVVQAAGFTCTNTIKLQVDELSLSRWTQLMVGLTAFSPETVVIRDYDNVNHTLTLVEATQMLQEVFAWGQWFFQDTWTKKDIITNS